MSDLPPPKRTWIYVISRVEVGVIIAPTKVGISSDPEKRLATLRTACPFQLRGVYAFRFAHRETALGVEGTFHALCKDFRTTGEWFDIQPITALHLVVAAMRAHGRAEGLSEELIDNRVELGWGGQRLRTRIEQLRRSGAFH